MKKRLLAILLVLVMVLGTVNVFAAVPYSPGIYEYTQDLSAPIEVSNASVADGSLTINANGYAVYDFTLPFDAGKLTVTYSASQDTELTIDAERSEYTAVLSSGETEKVIDLFPERMGAFEVTISASSTVTITNLLYTKVELSSNVSDNIRTNLVYPTEYEDAIRSSVVIPAGSNTIMTKGALRRVDMSDPDIKVATVDGKLYMPIGAFAHAFGMYYEDYPDLNYGYMSGETFIWYYKQSESWYEDAGKRIDMADTAVYIDNVLYVPVRAIAEAMGKTVDYRDGYAAVGMRTEVKKILHTDSIFEELCSQMGQFIGNTSAGGNEYHVAQTTGASDANSGTASAPFATIQKAADVATAGDTVIIHGGTYRESVTFENDGTGTQPIIFKAADGENVVVSAFDEVSGFAEYTNPANNQAMYKADVSALAFETTEADTWTKDRNFLIYNDATLLEGRHPNSDTSVARDITRLNYKKVEADGQTTYETYTEDFKVVKAYDFNPLYPDLKTNEILPTKGDMRFQDIIRKGSLGNPGTYRHTLYSDIDLNQTTTDYWKGATCMAMVGMGWSLVSSEVVASEYGKATIEEYWFGGFGPTYYEEKRASDYAWLTHHLNTVDEAGEWYLDNETKELYIIPPRGVDISSFKPEVKARQQVLDLTGRKYIQIENINTRGGGMTMNNAEGCILNGGSHRYISQVDLSLHADIKKACIYHAEEKLSGFSYQDDAPEYGEMGFYLGGSNNAILNADIEYSAAAGIYITGKNHYVYNNYVDKTGYGGTYATGIFVTRKGTEGQTTVKGGHQIFNNTSYGSYRAAIELEMGFEKSSEQGNIVVMKPYDIAYNELGWSNVAARDTGVFYQWGTVGGDDQERSRFHHNVAHDFVSASLDLGSATAANIYSDGLTSGFYFYDNISYSSSSDESYVAHGYHFNASQSASDRDPNWANLSDESAHEDGLTLTTIEYPNGNAFKVGATRDTDERFMNNYNKTQINDKVMLAESTLTGNAYADEDNYIVLPDANSSVEGSITLGDLGTYISVYYTDDLYVRTALDTLPNLTFSLYQNGALVYKNTKLISRSGRTLDSAERVNFQVPKDITGNVTFKLTSDKDTIRFSKLSATPFNYDAENAKQFFPYQSIPIVFGSADEIEYISSTGDAYIPKAVIKMTESAFDAYTYHYYTNARKNDFHFNDREFTHDVSGMMLVMGANGGTRDQTVKITATNESGETIELATIDLSETFEADDSWHVEYIPVELSQTLPKGTYDIEADFQYEKAQDAHAMIFY